MLSRRHFCCAGAMAVMVPTYGKAFAADQCTTITQERQAALTPDDVLKELKAGNERFVSQKMRNCDLLSQVRSTAIGQFPLAVIIGCIQDFWVPLSWSSIRASATFSALGLPATLSTTILSVVPSSRPNCPAPRWSWCWATANAARSRAPSMARNSGSSLNCCVTSSPRSTPTRTHRESTPPRIRRSYSKLRARTQGSRLKGSSGRAPCFAIWSSRTS